MSPIARYFESGQDVSIEKLLGGIESDEETETQAIQVTEIYGDVYTIHGDAEFNRNSTRNTLINVKEVIDRSTEIDGKTKTKFLEHIDNIFKEFTKDGARTGAKLGYAALKEYMKNEGIPEALRRAVKVASGGWLG